LQGEVMTHVPAKMVSEAMAFGSVEITTAGLPIILLNDAPTIGGYPKIGTVLSSDLSQLAQRKAGGLVQFELISVEQAQQARKRFNAFFA
jgi:allophanate hydrolase subunit 2